MVKLNNTFNADDVEPGGFTPLPVGKYKAVITESEMGKSRAGNPLLKFKIQVIDGPHNGRTLMDFCNYMHPNETARTIADQQLKAIGEAVSKKQFSDTSELHNLPLIIDVRQRKRDDNGEMTNEIKGYSSLASQEVETAPPASSSGNRPWEK